MLFRVVKGAGSMRRVFKMRYCARKLMYFSGSAGFVTYLVADAVRLRPGKNIFSMRFHLVFIGLGRDFLTKQCK